MAISIVKYGVLGFVEGISIGYIYFICGPMLQLLVAQRIHASDLPLQPITLYSSEALFLYLLLGGIAVFLQLRLFRGRARGVSIRSIPEDLGWRFKLTMKRYCAMHIAAYIVSAAYIFLNSKKYLGEHWMEANDALYSGSALAVVVGNFYNVLRITLPAIAYCMHRYLGYRPGTVAFALAIFSAVELIVSSNRIVLLLALMAIGLIYRQHWRRLLIVAAFVSPVLLQFNNVFAIVRSQLWVNATTVSAAIEAVEHGYGILTNEDSRLVAVLQSTFESTNIQIVDYTIDRYGNEDEYLLGETVFVKSMTFFLPRLIWADKPEGFNTRIGRQVTGSAILALNSTLLGEAYGNFGWYGLFTIFLVVPIVGRLFSVMGGPHVKLMGFFVAFAAWRFEFAFFAIGLFVISVMVLANAGTGYLIELLQGRRRRVGHV